MSYNWALVIVFNNKVPSSYVKVEEICVSQRLFVNVLQINIYESSICNFFFRSSCGVAFHIDQFSVDTRIEDFGPLALAS